jgi:hypothetical protein
VTPITLYKLVAVFGCGAEIREGCNELRMFRGAKLCMVAPATGSFTATGTTFGYMNR